MRLQIKEYRNKEKKYTHIVHYTKSYRIEEQTMVKKPCLHVYLNEREEKNTSEWEKEYCLALRWPMIKHTIDLVKPRKSGINVVRLFLKVLAFIMCNHWNFPPFLIHIYVVWPIKWTNVAGKIRCVHYLDNLKNYRELNEGQETRKRWELNKLSVINLQDSELCIQYLYKKEIKFNTFFGLFC